jgi:hypothetical protein
MERRVEAIRQTKEWGDSDLPPWLQGADFIGSVAQSCEDFGRHTSHPTGQIDSPQPISC